MSLASDYADVQAAAATELVNANVAVPPPFVGPNGRAEVTVKGELRLVPGGTSSFEIPAAAALLFRDWLTATFG